MITIYRLTGGGSIPPVRDVPVAPAPPSEGPVPPVRPIPQARFDVPLLEADMPLLEQLHARAVRAYADAIETRLIRLLGLWQGGPDIEVWVGPEGFPIGLGEPGQPGPSLTLADCPHEATENDTAGQPVRCADCGVTL